jgi:molybdate transport system regulatory protein
MQLVVYPYLDTTERGVFSTRSPVRPNHIGLSVVRLQHVDQYRMYIADVDMLDGTPLLDIKPYVPAFDSFEQSHAGWLNGKSASDVVADSRFESGKADTKYADQSCAFETVCGTVDSRRGSTLRCDANPAIDWRRQMKISARNVFEGKVQTVTKGAVNSEVALVLTGGERIVSVITNSSVDSLGLVESKTAYAIIKANEVIVGKGVDGSKLSARNVLAGEVISSHDGAVNSELAIKLAGGATVIASITKESVRALGLQQGDKVSAIVKASNVLIGV